MRLRFFITLSILVFLTVNSVDVNGAEPDLQLTLPPAIYAVPELETNIYFDNIVLSQTSDQYRFKVTCDLGETKTGSWACTPKQSDVGKHALSVEVYGADDALLEEASTVLQIIPRTAGTHEKIRLLIIGDSLTHATAYPNEIARLLSQPGNPDWQMLGTHKTKSASKGVIHEGYGGWTWARFVTKYEPNPDGTYRNRSSPFVFLNDNEKPQLDVPRYFDESCDGERPDYVVMMLGINDCFSAPADDVAKTDIRIDAVFGHADKLIAAIRKAAPEASIGICLTTPPNSRQEAFFANYKDRYSRWGWKRIQHRLVQRQIEHVVTKNDPQISIIPTELNLDPVDGYPVNNGVHPNAAGYKQIGASIYSWLKWQMSEPDDTTNTAEKTPEKDK